MSDKFEFDFRLNILDICVIVLTILFIAITVYISYHIKSVKEIEKHLDEIKQAIIDQGKN